MVAGERYTDTRTLEAISAFMSRRSGRRRFTSWWPRHFWDQTRPNVPKATLTHPKTHILRQAQTVDCVAPAWPIVLKSTMRGQKIKLVGVTINESINASGVKRIAISTTNTRADPENEHSRGPPDACHHLEPDHHKWQELSCY